MKTNIVVVIPTLNAAEHLASCLNSARDADAVVLFDQGSTDETLGIAMYHGVQVMPCRGMSFAATGEAVVRTWIIQQLAHEFPHATHYVCLDADDVLIDSWRGRIETCIDIVNPSCIRLPYWQLMGDARYSQTVNPVENRPFVWTSTCGLSWPGVANQNYHTFPAYNGSATILPGCEVIHLGYTGDLLKRWHMNNDRGDWTKEDTRRADYASRINKNPFQFLQPVVPTAQDLLAKSTVLRDLATYHARTRRITFEPVGDGAQQIIHIDYDA